MTHTTEVVAEVAGRLNARTENVPVGTESSHIARLGTRATWGAMRLDGAVIVGLTPRDPDFGFTAGFTWAFRAFNAP